MIFHAIDRKIRERFSQAAVHYDVLTGLHKEIGRELSKRFAHLDPCAAILDVGMGTGWFTSRLTQMFPEALVVGIDFASGMIARAREKDRTFWIAQADAAHLPFKKDTFGLVTSNLAYQWVDDLAQAFAACHSCLKEDGEMHLTMFGHDTFEELFASLNACRGHQSFDICRLADSGQVRQALTNAGFRDICVDHERIKVRFADMMGLIKWIKDIGANALPKDDYLGRDLLRKANDYYHQHFHDRLGIYATLEVIWVEARR